jgi:hypothetical protein
VRKFEEGTPQEWIDMLRDLKEIWTQNSMTGGTDRASTVRALVRGESAVAFKTSLQDYRTSEGGETVPISPDHVQQALKAVRETVFPHRALETHKLYVQTGRVDNKTNGCINQTFKQRLTLFSQCNRSFQVL